MTTTVLCWYWHQPGVKSAYTADHVNIWADMVRKNLSMPHRIACVTDIPSGIDSSIEVITPPGEFADVRIPTWDESRPQCLRRLVMFAPNAAGVFGERIICMDLDCVISRPLDKLFVEDADFRICRGTTSDRPYNGSMFMLKTGTRPQAYTEFTPEKAAAAGRQYLGSDQAWLGKILPRERTWSEDDGVLFWDAIGQLQTPTSCVTFFPGTPKPWDVVANGMSEWAQKHYRADHTGRCLVVGKYGDVWGQVSRSLETGPFDRVIIVPEIEPYWRGKRIVAADDSAAKRIAAMLGFTDVTYCGFRRTS